jgi:predicted  nucleic acid-binding Zn-ribbon protein
MTTEKGSMWQATYQSEPTDLAVNVKSYEDRITALESKLTAAEADIQRLVSEAIERESLYQAERDKVRVLREAAELALAIAESWIHDQLDGTSLLENSLSDLDPVRKALVTTEPEDV